MTLLPITRPVFTARSNPRLLVSVRTPDEAAIALAGGADLIDAKEPERGSLGVLDERVVKRIAQRSQNAPLSAALGELIHDTRKSRPEGLPVWAIKAGPAGCTRGENVERWPALLERLAQRLRSDQQLVMVVYADWERAQAPPPPILLAAACDLGARWMLIDTHDKTVGSVLDIAQAWLPCFLDACREAGMQTALAGGLSIEQLVHAAELGPDVVAIRGAACVGGRRGRVSATLVAEAKRRVEVAMSR